MALCAQVAPNLSRLLRRWGMLDALRDAAMPLARNSLRRYADDTELGQSPFMSVAMSNLS
jgi:salicylate hydroxylase